MFLSTVSPSDVCEATEVVQVVAEWDLGLRSVEWERGDRSALGEGKRSEGREGQGKRDRARALERESDSETERLRTDRRSARDGCSSPAPPYSSLADKSLHRDRTVIVPSQCQQNLGT